MADVNVPILSTEVLYSMLRAKGRSVLFRRIPQAGHSLIPDDADFGANMPRLEAEFQRIIDWFDGKP
jgi:dipeptidyl aminopeptidase/acylaminoacyl peptidase